MSCGFCVLLLGIIANGMAIQTSDPARRDKQLHRIIQQFLAARFPVARYDNFGFWEDKKAHSTFSVFEYCVITCDIVEIRNIAHTQVMAVMRKTRNLK